MRARHMHNVIPTPSPPVESWTTSYNGVLEGNLTPILNVSIYVAYEPTDDTLLTKEILSGITKDILSGIFKGTRKEILNSVLTAKKNEILKEIRKDIRASRIKRIS